MLYNHSVPSRKFLRWAKLNVSKKLIIKMIRMESTNNNTGYVDYIMD